VLPEDIDIVARAIAEVTAPLLERIAMLEARGPVKGEKGDKGDAGEPGAAGVGEPGPVGPVGPSGRDGLNGSDGAAGKDGANGLDGKDGRDGIDGKDADPEVVKALVAEAVQKAVALIPVAKDGRDGIDGKDGQPGRDGLSGQPGRDGEKGADGLNGKDGADGLGFGDLVAEYDGERRFVLRAVREDRTLELGTFGIPAQVYRGVWQQGKAYERGDTATWAGSIWHCNESTSDKPGDGSKAWTLCVKKGADGRVGPEGKAGPQGPRGEQGPQGPKVY
jgi:integrin beta 3